MLNISRLSLAEAGVVLQAAHRKAAEIGVPMCIAVVDESGNLIAFERMDGAKILPITVAQDKAMTAATIGKGTHEIGANAQPGQPAFGISSAAQGRFMIVAGGLPIHAGSQVVGGIGVSSGSPAQDLEVARAGVAAFAGEESA